MAKQVITKMLDDLDGGEADETVAFAMDGFAYEIDLSSKNAARLRDMMSPFQQAGTRLGRAINGAQAQLRSYKPAADIHNVAENRAKNQRIRVWAADNGYDLNDRGRIPQHIVDAYEAGTPNPAWVDAQRLKGQQEQEEQERPRRRSTRKPVAAAFAAPA